MSGLLACSAVPTPRLVASVDEAFTRNLVWEYSSSLVSAERGDLQNDFIEITEDEANQIDRTHPCPVTGTSNA